MKAFEYPPDERSQRDRLMNGTLNWELQAYSEEYDSSFEILFFDEYKPQRDTVEVILFLKPSGMQLRMDFWFWYTDIHEMDVIEYSKLIADEVRKELTHMVLYPKYAETYIGKHWEAVNGNQPSNG